MTNELVELTGEDMELAWHLSSAKPCSLESSPGDDDNWIERAGGSLPDYICRVAKGIMRSGKSKSAAIAIAISRIKKWAAGMDDVNADTRAKAAAALAQWEKLKAKHKAKQLVKASTTDGEDYIILSSVDSYSLDQVREAWDAHQRAQHTEVVQESGIEVADKVRPYTYVREVYVDYIVIRQEGLTSAHPNPYFKVNYTVTDSGEVMFGEPTEIKLEWTDPNSDWRATARS